MRWTTGLLAGACLVSLGANAWQVATREPAAGPPVPTRTARRTTASASAGPQPGLPVGEKRGKAIPDDITKLGRAELEQRLAAAEARLDKALPLDEKFDLDAPSPDIEVRMRSIFDRVFQTKPGEPPLYALECHGPVCRLDTEVSPNEWQQALFAEEDAIFSSMQVGPTSYFRLEEPGRAAGLKYSTKLILAFWQSPATKECKSRNPASGSVSFALHLDGAAHKVLVTTSGALANAPVGVCLRRALEDLIDTTPAPAEMTAVVEDPFEVRVP